MILLVEDNPDNGTVYSAMLDHAGFTVVQAKNGNEGVQRALKHRPDLILMDIEMPVMDDWTAAAEIRRAALTARTPVLALSACDCDRTPQELGAAGFIGWLQKPISPSAVLQAVRSFFGGGG